MASTPVAKRKAGTGSRTRSPRGTGGELRTQQITAADIGRGQIRIPITGPTKSAFPGDRSTVVINLLGKPMTVPWDPGFDPDKERSGVLSVGRPLRDLVQPAEVLRVTREDDGSFRLERR